MHRTCNQSLIIALALFYSATLIACSDDDATSPDGGVPAGGMPDGGMPDGGMPDGAVPDGEVPDGAVPDGEVPDGGMPDGGMPDGGMPDSGMPDSGMPDSGMPIDPCTGSFGTSCDVIAGSYLKASNTGAGDRFGYSVSLDGDTLAVGAVLESSATGSDFAVSGS